MSLARNALNDVVNNANDLQQTKTNCRIAVVALIRLYNLDLEHQHNYQHADRLPAQT